MKWSPIFPLYLLSLCCLIFSAEGCRQDSDKKQSDGFPDFIALSQDTVALPERATSMAFIRMKRSPDSSFHLRLREAPEWTQLEQLTPEVHRLLIRAPRKGQGWYTAIIEAEYRDHRYTRHFAIHVERFRGHAYSLDGPKYWSEALRRAELGDMILLMDGDFGDLEIAGKKAGSLLISRAAHYAPKVRSITIKASSGIDIFGLDLGPEASADTAIGSGVSIDEDARILGIHNCWLRGGPSSAISAQGDQVNIYHNFIQSRQHPLVLAGKNIVARDNLVE